jgi:hypothetical protein
MRADDGGAIAQAPLALNQMIVATVALTCAMLEDARERITQTDNRSTIRAYAALIRQTEGITQ